MPKLTHSIYLSIIAILGVAIVWLILDPPLDAARDTEAARKVSSIAILPFIALSEEASAQQLADKITTRIIDNLDITSHLSIASSEKTRALVGINLSIREIGERLSVAMILEGAVHQTEDRVRVAVQLIDARTDEHLWAETFDWNIDDLDGLVAEIGQAIMSPIRD